MSEYYWILNLDSNVTDNKFSLTISAPDQRLPNWRETKVVFLLKDNELVAICRVARLRKTLSTTEVLLDRRIEASASWNEDWQKSQLDLRPSSILYAVSDDLTAAQFVARCLPQPLESLPPFAGTPDRQIQTYIRRLAVLAFEDDELGPADGPRETIEGVSVRDRYLVGRLPPRNTFLSADADQDLDDDREESREDDSATATARAEDISVAKPDKKLMLQPSSIGLSFMVEADTCEVMIEAGWGRYVKHTEKHFNNATNKDENSTNKGFDVDIWTRNPHQITRPVSLNTNNGDFELEAGEGVNLKLIVRPSGSKKIVTMFLENRIEHSGENVAPDDKWIFQPYLRVFDQNNKPIFLSRTLSYNDGMRDQELERLDMLYRDECEFAVGHGVSVHSELGTEKRRAISVETRMIPKYEVPFTETPGTADTDREQLRRLVNENALDMEELARLATPENRQELLKTLNVLADDYANWIEEQKTKAVAEPDIEEPGLLAVKQCCIALRRLREGIQTLADDDNALQAFAFANRSMALQRVRSQLIGHNQAAHSRSEAVRMDHARDEDFVDARMKDPRNHSWRAFQLAFFLLILPSLADPSHEHRTEEAAVGDLLWFPTGGGKTEAYLGAAAFAMAIRRLQKPVAPDFLDPSRGLAVIMRYTLRLLTLQQFQRASTLICAMETLRQADTDTWGKSPFSIGLWVGSASTPNSIESASSMVAEAQNPHGKLNADEPPFQVTRCPWCGEPLRIGSDVQVDAETLQLHIFCSNPDCDFSGTNTTEGLPLKVVDEEIYRRPPSMLIATVDKFAQMALKGEVRSLFGLASKECSRHGLVLPDCDCHKLHKPTATLPEAKVEDINPIRPPDLIIQDEFHLISGPLGTMVGLYETAVDALCSWQIEVNGQTHTVRPKVVASTATVRKAADQMKGVFCRNMQMFPPNGLDAADNFFSVQRPIESYPGRLYLGLCAPGSAKPPVMIRLYVTLLTVAQDLYSRFGALADPYMSAVGYFSSLRELGGMKRLAEDDVRTRCNRIEGKQQLTYRAGMKNRSLRSILELTSRVSNKEIPLRLDQMSQPWNPDPNTSVSPDIVLATNMLSVGVDVDRLGLMAVNGQPKNTAEYIQATSRVGRKYPGLVCTVYAWSRPRDLSHYEKFEHYHATFYKHVEAQSVTPFSSRALDKGLNGALVSYVRLKNANFAHEKGANNVKAGDLNFDTSATAELFSKRAWKVTTKRAVDTDVKSRIEDALVAWEGYASDPESELVYTDERKSQRPKKLLRTDNLVNSTGEWLVPTSMREVEPPVCLLLDEQAIKPTRNYPWPQKLAKDGKASKD